MILILITYFFLSANCGNVYEVDKKIYYLNRIPAQWSIPYTLINQQDKDQVHNLNYPIVFKPNKCTGCGVGVERIDSPEEALEYLNKTDQDQIIAQKLDERPREFSIMYERHPLSSSGKVVAITEKIPVKKDEHFNTYNLGIGDRKSDVVDHTRHLTPPFNHLIDTLTKNVPDFYVGRYDVKADSLDDLLKGNFGVLELNGLFGLDHRSYVNTINEFDYKNAMTQYKWFTKRALIGLESNLVHGPRKIYHNLSQEKMECPEHRERAFKVIRNILIHGFFPLIIIGLIVKLINK